jgi:hypothetical protein
VPLAGQWAFYNPEGISTLANQSAGGFDVTVADIRGTIVPDPGNAGEFLSGNPVRPRVYQVFEDLNMSRIGDAVKISFDFELRTPLIENNRGDLHIFLFDASTNYEMFSMVHLGPNPDREGVGDFMKFRIDGELSPGGTFDPNNVAGLGVGGQSRAGKAHHLGKPLAGTGILHTFTMRVERVSGTELSYSLTWENEGNASTHSFAAYNEATGVIDGAPNPGKSDIWGNGRVSQFNGFGLMFHDDDPFDRDGNDATPDSGTIRITNAAVDYSTNEHPPFKITGVTKGGAGNLVRWEAINGATYSLWSTFDFKNWSELSDSILATGGIGEFTDTESAGADFIFYQVRWDQDNQ